MRSPSASSLIRKVLRGMHEAVIGIAELRNRFGTGHGRHRRSSDRPPARSPMLAVANPLAVAALPTE